MSDAFRRFRILGTAAVALAASLLIPSFALAQKPAGTAIIAPAPMHAAHVRPMAAGAAARPVRANTNFTTPGAPHVSFGPGNFGPGMGFSGNFTNGIGDIGVEAAIDPATQLRIATAEKLFRLRRPFAGFGYYLFDDAGYVTPVDDSVQVPPPNPSQQPIIVVEQQAPAQAGATSNESAAPLQEVAPPLPDVGHFTLVLRNGSKIEAVAFSQMNGRIVYIATDGTRHTLSAGDLDVESTKQVNEESGTSLRF
jgi:hypothetical protein